MEPGRRAPYSADLRWRIVWQRIAKELTFKQIGSRLGVSPSTAYRIYKLFVETSDVQAKKNKAPRLCKMNDSIQMFVVGLVLETPSLYLHELCVKVKDVSGIEVCPPAICKLLHKHGMTRKKIRQVAVQRSAKLRGNFMAQVLLRRSEMYVWLDETGCDNRNYMRKYGYALRGSVPICHRLLARGQRVSAIAAISTEGLVALELSTGTVNSDLFYDFIRGSLIPQMNIFDGVSPKSIVIMDNCSIHHVQEVERLFNDAGIPVIFLPPYSPDYNPIEETFSYIKYYLKKHDDILQALSDPCSIIKSAFYSITPEHCLQWIEHSGYQS